VQPSPSSLWTLNGRFDHRLFFLLFIYITCLYHSLVLDNVRNSFFIVRWISYVYI